MRSLLYVLEIRSRGWTEEVARRRRGRGTSEAISWIFQTVVDRRRSLVSLLPTVAAFHHVVI